MLEREVADIPGEESQLTLENYSSSVNAGKMIKLMTGTTPVTRLGDGNSFSQRVSYTEFNGEKTPLREADEIVLNRELFLSSGPLEGSEWSELDGNEKAMAENLYSQSLHWMQAREVRESETYFNRSETRALKTLHDAQVDYSLRENPVMDEFYESALEGELEEFSEDHGIAVAEIEGSEETVIYTEDEDEVRVFSEPVFNALEGEDNRIETGEPGLQALEEELEIDIKYEVDFSRVRTEELEEHARNLQEKTDRAFGRIGWADMPVPEPWDRKRNRGLGRLRKYDSRRITYSMFGGSATGFALGLNVSPEVGVLYGIAGAVLGANFSAMRQKTEV